MSERVSDEHLRLLEQALERIETDYKPTCESVSYGSGCPGATSESIDFWRRAVDCVPSMMAELRSRRAADLSAEDYAALEFARWALGCRGQYGDKRNHDAALATLDRLLAARKP